MITREQWQSLKNEFGNDAHKRLLIKFKNQLLPIQDNQTAEMSLDIIESKPLTELWVHDDSYYIDAYTMWEISLADKNEFFNAKSNDDIFDALNSVNYDCRRKDSAAMPFDLKRAKAGDVVECRIYTGKWVELKSFELCKHAAMTPCILYGHYGENKNYGYDYFSNQGLCMKYPPRKPA
jgi:hypothetical protein